MAFLLLAVAAQLADAVRADESFELATARRAADSQLADHLATLAAKCDELKLVEQASTTRDWIIPRDARRQYLFLPDSDPTVPAATAPDLVQRWHAKFREVRAEQADRLFALSEQALAAHEPAMSYRLLHEVLHENPDHPEARRVLGYRPGTKGDWLPAPRNWPAATGRTDQPKLGWRRGRYWRVETPNFRITTNHSPKAGQQLAAELENLLTLWKQTFFSFWADETTLANQFAGRQPFKLLSAPMNVVLFKNRDEYVAALGPNQPQIGVTLGIYLDSQETSYFYVAEPPLRSTWLHEATHQLFQELGRYKPGVGEQQNFWIVEGAAMYMESLANHGHYWTVGGWEADRLQVARYRALSGDYYLPLEKLVLLGRESIQQDPDIRKLYSQAAGLAHFLLDGQRGAHREAAIAYLLAIYRQHDDPHLLPRLTNTGLAELDKQYLQFLQVTDDDLKAAPDLSSVTQLSLGRTAVTDAGLVALKPCDELTWLDLSLTHTSDRGLENIQGASKLQQLFLEATKITDASLPLISNLSNLEELDLSRLAITDAGLTSIARLRKLKSLYLTGSPITDEGLARLKNLQQLESLDLRATRVTAEGIDRLQQALPRLTIQARAAQ